MGYVAGQWESCSVTCETGVQLRKVICMGSNNEAVAESMCAGQTRPLEGRTCNTGISCGLRWKTGEWAACSQTCDGGIQKRTVQCVSGGLVQEDGLCASLTYPSTFQSCAEFKCGSQSSWYRERWCTSEASPCNYIVPFKASYLCTDFKGAQVEHSMCKDVQMPSGDLQCTNGPATMKD